MATSRRIPVLHAHGDSPFGKTTPRARREEEVMKHVLLSDAWEFSTEPFPAYRANLVYGRNKRDRAFLPVKDVMPVTQYTVTADFGKTVLYSGTDKATAEAVKVQYDAEQRAKAEKDSPSWRVPTAEIRAGLPTLPQDKFRVIKTKEKGTILVVPGEDKTNRCLLFVGCEGGFRGGVSVLEEGTTGTILKKCSAGNACESSVEVIVLLEPGQSIAFHTYGRSANEVYVYTWNGVSVEKKHFSKAEWESRNVFTAQPTEDAEEL